MSSSASPTPSDPPALIGDFSTLPEQGMTVVIYLQEGNSPEILSITNGRKDPCEGMVPSSRPEVDDLEKRLMALKYTEPGKRKKRKTHKRKNKRSIKKSRKTRK